MKHYHKNRKPGLLNSSIRLVCFIIFISFSITACKKDAEPQQTNKNVQAQTEEQLMVTWGKPDIVVHKGQSIQSAINKAKKGYTIFIEPGIYKEALLVDKPGIKLIGKVSISGDEVVIKNSGNEEDGIKVTDNGDGFVLANVTVMNFLENGVFLEYADNYIISHVKAINNKQYGIFPFHCNHGLIEFCTATGSSDTGIYVGESSDVKMQFNIAYANVIGLEVENSSFVDVAFNKSYNNAAGMIIDVLPGKDVKTCKEVHIYSNLVYKNNHENFGDSGELEASVPVGTGILLLGADQCVVESNTVTGNNFTGIVTFSTLVLAVIAGVPPEDILGDIEPDPDNNVITGNFLKNNGSNPPVIPDLPLPGVDLLYDGTGTNNCWGKNIYTTSYPSPLPSCN